MYLERANIGGLYLPILYLASDSLWIPIPMKHCNHNKIIFNYSVKYEIGKSGKVYFSAVVSDGEEFRMILCNSNIAIELIIEGFSQFGRNVMIIFEGFFKVLCSLRMKLQD